MLNCFQKGKSNFDLKGNSEPSVYVEGGGKLIYVTNYVNMWVYVQSTRYLNQEEVNYALRKSKEKHGYFLWFKWIATTKSHVI